MAGIPARQIPSKPTQGTTTTRSSSAPAAPATPAGSIFLYGVDACLAAVMLVVPFVMGGRIVAGEILLCGFALGAAGCWSLHRLCGREQGWQWTGMELLFLPGLGLMILQLLPLDSGMMNLLSPKLYELLPLWSPQSDASDRLGTWTQLSLYPAMTRQGLTLLVAYTLLFFTTIQRIRTAGDVERLLTWMGFASCAMALFGLAQFFGGNGKFFWVYEHPQTTTSDYVKGAFSNRNHFAHFLALGVGPLLWLLLRFFLPQTGSSSRRSSGGKEIIAGGAAIGLGCVIFAALLSLSRGGALALFTAGGVGLLLFWRAATLNGRILLGMGLVLLFVGVGLAMHGQESVGNRLDDFLSADLKKLDHKDGRMDLWSTVWRAGNAFSMTGAGVGTHRELYPAYLQTPVGVDFTHAENGYLQMFEETGICGLGLMALGILACGLCCVRGVACRQPVLAGCAAALGASLAASTVHSLMDFVWYVPGIMGVMSILTAALFRISSLASEQASGTRRMMPVPRLAWVAGLLAVCGAGAWSTPQLVARLKAEPHWVAYQRLAVDHSLTQPEEDTKGQPDSKSIMVALQNIVKENPDDARAHARLARLYLVQFERMQQKSENSMTVGQIRDAVLASKFESTKAEDAWLNKALGKSRKLLDLAYKHSLEALQRCPLQGDVYLFFSELVFLKDPNKTDLSPYWEQSVKLRPYDGMVLLSAGQEYFSRQEFDQAFQYWQRAFRCGGTPRQTLIQSLAGQLKAEQFLKLFEPDVETSLLVVKRYQALKQAAEVKTALKYTAKVSEEEAKKLDGTVGAHTWLTAFNAYKELKAAKPALACLKKAYDADPSDYDVRFAYGQWALEQKDFATAEEHLEWCSDRRPSDDTLKEMAKYASKNAVGKRAAREIAELPEEQRSGSSRR